MNIKIAIVQFNPTVGAVKENAEGLLKAYFEAQAQGADIVVAPESSLAGYPLEDLVLRRSFLDMNWLTVQMMHQKINNGNNTAMFIFGAPLLNSKNEVNNCAITIDPKTGEFNIIAKYELPNYGVFDEKRVFVQGTELRAINFRGRKIGVLICEDTWFPKVSQTLKQDGAELLISINGSPYEVGKNVTRRKVVANRIKETGLPVLYVNLVGGQDELVFDGGSFFMSSNSRVDFPEFKEGIFYTNFNFDEPDLPQYRLEDMTVQPTNLGSIYGALVLGLRDYMGKQGFKGAVLGMSGGVDSAIVAAIAADAIGPENVHLVRLPSEFSSKGSLDDAEDAAKLLGANLYTLNIQDMVNVTRSSLQEQIGLRFDGLTDENAQPRIRGLSLMAISNERGWLVLSTGNKSEVSVGYSTLYGDMVGGFNPIKDCYKLTVFDLCAYRNTLTDEQVREFGFKGPAGMVVPTNITTKPPSAELRPDQKDEDSLPPYPVLDAILQDLIEHDLSVKEIVEKGFEQETVEKVLNLLLIAEYKRRQSCPGVKITGKIFGRDRRYPINNRFRD